MESVTESETVSLIIAEYTALRDEIIKLTELQYQIVSLSILAISAVLTIGFQGQGERAPVVLLYPVFALCMCLCWLNHAYGIQKLGAYIRTQIEPKVNGHIGWENFSRQKRPDHYMLGYLGTRMIFIGTSLLAIVSGSLLMHANTIDIVFLAIAIVCTGICTWSLFHWSEPL